RQRSVLQQRGIRRRTRLFFYGPPGCCKSLTARALAKELGLPIYVVRFDGVIGAYLGQTAIHLRQLFHFAESVPCILLFDELDALGKKRGNPLDVGELDRIVIALMQELEHTSPSGAIIATSNLPRHVDDALWRRFDLAVQFPSPTKAELQAFGKSIATTHQISFGPRIKRRIATAKSFAEAEKLVEAEARRMALSEG
ncbi:MAG TPA: ATP-binding protein, partial [Pirellulales bacterium]|nr:ATP-binding protein [Pirellulales bacterium]